MVRTRVLLGTAIVAGFLALMWLDSFLRGGPLFHVLVGAVLMCGLLEFYALAERGGSRPLKQAPEGLVGLFVAADLVARVTQGQLLGGWLGVYPSELTSFYAPMGMAAALGVLLVAVGHVLFGDPRRWLADAPATALGLLYVWFLGAHVFAIHGFEPGYVLLFIAVAKLGDAGAFFVGRQWGRRRLAPLVSPNKTVEGALGGLATSVAVSAVLAWVCGAEGGVRFWLLFGLLVGAAAQLGDLVESALKRSADVKDSAQLFPHFGGVLDMADSMIFSAPVAFWLLLAR